jgi:predicted nucleic acid-binding Zn ribbon protein
MSRRLGPRPLSLALASAIGQARPAGLLAAVQSAWPPVAGPVLAGAASPASEQSGIVTVECESGVWAQELELLAPDLMARLNGQLEAAGEQGRVERLRFVVGSGANAP